MGVHGLTTYIRHHRARLSQPKVLPPITGDAEVTPIVVDGWSLIYNVYKQARLPWLYGGEYAAFSKELRRLVTAWRSVGLEPVVVFDGPTPGLKFGTVISRLESSRKELLVTYRSSLTARLSTASFVIPPLVYAAAISALTGDDPSWQPVECHFADSEGDGYAVELARLRGAWVAGNDSDFVIYIGSVCGEGPGIGMGYAPLDQMVWISEDVATPAGSSVGGEDENFQPVKSKRRKTSRSSGLLPPTSVDSALSLSLTFYPPLSLSTQLNIPPTHLPLFASFLGTDFTQPTIMAHLHAQGTSPLERVERTAKALRNASKPPAPSRKGGDTPVLSFTALDILLRTIQTLALRSPLPQDVGDLMRENIIASTLQYALPPSMPPCPSCPLHSADQCLLPTSLLPSDFDNYPYAQTKRHYLSAYRAGEVAPELLDPIATGTFWPSIFLEDPDTETPAVWIGREIRGWIYAVLEEALGILDEPELLGEEDDEGTESYHSDDDVLVGLSDSDEEDVEESTQGSAYTGSLPEHASPPDQNPSLRSLYNKLHRLRGSLPSSPAPSVPQTAAPTMPPSPTLGPTKRICVTEYVRRAQRIVPERVEVRRMVDLLPVDWTWEIEVSHGKKEVPFVLRAEEDRLNVFLHALGGEVPSVRLLLDQEQQRATLHLVLAARLAIRSAAQKGPDTKWRKSELYALARSTFSSAKPKGKQSSLSSIPLSNRAIAFTAHFLHALENVAWWAEAALLHGHCGGGEALFSGSRLHAALALALENPTDSDLTNEARKFCSCVEDMLDEEMWGIEKGKKVTKREKKGKGRPLVAGGGSTSGRGMWAALEGLRD